MSHKCHHHHHDDDSCCCCCHEHDEACKQHDPCHKHTDHEDCEECAEKFLELADKAWMELLKEKIKAKIAATCNDSLEQLAGIVSEANHHKWKEIMASKKCCCDYRTKLKEHFQKECNSNECKSRDRSGK